MNVEAFFQAVWAQDAEALASFFAPDAYVNWHCTNEHFTAAEFVRTNCEYPGEWDGEIERIETSDDLTIAAARVYTKDRGFPSMSSRLSGCGKGKSSLWTSTGGMTAPLPNGVWTNRSARLSCGKEPELWLN